MTNYHVYIDESGLFEPAIKMADKHQKPVRLVASLIVPESVYGEKKELRDKLLCIGKKYFSNITAVTQIHMTDQSLIYSGRQNELREELISFFRDIMTGVMIAFVYDDSILKNAAQQPNVNLYRHMLLNLLKAVTIYHPQFEPNSSFTVKVAHRRFSSDEIHDLSMNEAGYLKLRSEDGVIQFSAITQADLVTIMHALEGFLPFKQQRKARYTVKPYHRWDDPFMVFADVVSNSLFKEVARNREYGWREESLLISTEKIFGSNTIVFLSRADEEPPFSTLNSYFKSNWAEFVNGLLSRDFSKPSDYLLLDNAIRGLPHHLTSLSDPNECMNILQIAHRYLDARLYNKIQIVKELASIVEPAIQKNITNPDWLPVSFFFNDISLRYCNHTGNVIDSINHREAAEKAFDLIKDKNVDIIRKYNEFLNRASIADTNEFSFERAITRLTKIMVLEEQMTKIFGDARNVNLGKIYGSLAQNYAFLGEYDNAYRYFCGAAQHLGWNNFMQASYRAHMYIDAHDEEKYQMEMKELGLCVTESYETPICSCLNSLDNEVSQFNLILLMKGMLVFKSEYLDSEKKMIEDVYSRVRARMNTVKEIHPWQLIFSNLGRILHRIKKDDEAIMCWNVAINITSDPRKITLTLMGHAARALLAMSLLNNGDHEGLRKQVLVIVNYFKGLNDDNVGRGIYNPHKTPDHDGYVWKGWFDEAVANLIQATLQSENYYANVQALKTGLKDFLNRFTFTYW
ncbi:MAG: hypothetical protein AB2L22_12945 [Syntrophales bacterium]